MSHGAAQALGRLSLPRKARPVSAPVAGAVLAGAVAIGLAVAVAAEHSLLLFLALLGIAALAVLLAWPQMALPIAVFLVWTNAPTLAVAAGAPGVLAVAIPLILVAPLATAFLRGETLSIDRTLLYMLVLLGVFVLSTLVSERQDTAFASTLTLVTEGIVLYFLVFNAVRTPAELRRATSAVVAAGSFLAAITVFQHLTQTFDRPYFGFSPLDIAYFVGKADTPRALGPVADANYYAQILVATVAIALPMLRTDPSRLRRLLLGISVALMTLALAFTYSRGGTLALLVVVIGMVILGVLKLRHLAVLALAIVALVTVVPGYGERVGSLTKIGGVTAQTGASNQADEAARSRFTENVAAILVVFDYPALGVGPGAFGSYYQEYAGRTGGTVHRATKRDKGKAPEREAHNLFLSAAAETGVLGLLALIAVLATAFRQLARGRRRWPHAAPYYHGLMKGLMLALVGYVSAGVFLTLAFERYLWLLLALMGAAAVIARDHGSRRAGRVS